MAAVKCCVRKARFLLPGQLLEQKKKRKEPYVGFRLNIMRIQFRASGFGLVAKINYHSCKIETGFMCGDGARVIRFFARVVQQLGFRTQKIQAKVDYCYVRRRAECSSLGPGPKHPSLRSESSLAAKRRAEAIHVVLFFNKASEPSTRAAALSILSHDT